MPTTEQALTIALRRARKDVFSSDERIAEQASKDIDSLKAQLKPYWDTRADHIKVLADDRLAFITD
jgi:hypothetical protein